MSVTPCNLFSVCVRRPVRAGCGGKVAIIHDHGSTTYHSLHDLTSRVGNGLICRGICYGDRVMIALPDGLPFAASLMAIVAVGAVAVMIDPESLRIEAAACEAGAKMIIGNPDKGHVPFGELINEVDNVLDVFPTSTHDDAIWLYSGGTTGGRQKIVRQRHGALVAVAKYLARDYMGYTSADSTLSVPRLFFGYATGGNLIFPLSVGATAILKSAWPTPEAIFKQVREYHPTILINTPAMIAKMIDWAEEHPGACDLSSVRMMTSAGEKLPEAIAERWARLFPNTPPCDGLGFAEHWYFCSLNRPGECVPGTVGRIIPGVQVRICDDDGCQLPMGEVGNLWVTGPAMANGYYNDPEANAASFRDGWFVGGDLAKLIMHTDGFPRLVYVGRVSNAFKVSGRWVFPSEIENCLLTHPAVDECAVVSYENQQGLTKPIAFVRCKNGQSVTMSDLQGHVLDHLESYKCPATFQILDDPLPRTSLGKVDLAALRARI